MSESPAEVAHADFPFHNRDSSPTLRWIMRSAASEI